jgi:hypothetical protein
MKTVRNIMCAIGGLATAGAIKLVHKGGSEASGVMSMRETIAKSPYCQMVNTARKLTTADMQIMYVRRDSLLAYDLYVCVCVYSCTCVSMCVCVCVCVCLQAGLRLPPVGADASNGPRSSLEVDDGIGQLHSPRRAADPLCVQVREQAG